MYDSMIGGNNFWNGIFVIFDQIFSHYFTRNLHLPSLAQNYLGAVFSYFLLLKLFHGIQPSLKSVASRFLIFGCENCSKSIFACLTLMHHVHLLYLPITVSVFSRLHHTVIGRLQRTKTTSIRFYVHTTVAPKLLTNQAAEHFFLFHIYHRANGREKNWKAKKLNLGKVDF